MKIAIIVFWILGFFMFGAGIIYILFVDVLFGLRLFFLAMLMAVIAFVLREVRTRLD